MNVIPPFKSQEGDESRPKSGGAGRTAWNTGCDIFISGKSSQYSHFLRNETFQRGILFLKASRPSENTQRLAALKNWLKVQSVVLYLPTLKDNANTLFIRGGPCHLFSFNQCPGLLFSSENSLYMQFVLPPRSIVSFCKRYHAVVDAPAPVNNLYQQLTRCVRGFQRLLATVKTFWPCEKILRPHHGFL